MHSSAWSFVSWVFFVLAGLFAVVPLLIALLLPEWSGALWAVLLAGGWVIAGAVARSRAQFADVVARNAHFDGSAGSV
ncbi:hypothetical protein [Marisediminicola sp. LYQ85]|uniref:hypothetical protein n=1 Tax=Marisediminicola sp. LYQ85 TaxID=3391062 RepID=UPI00398352C3